MQKLFALFVLFFLPVSLFAFTVPAKPTGFVQDYAKILSVEQVSALENKLEAFERQTTNEIAVVTIPSLDGDTIENVAQEIFTKWGIGKKDKNNGVLLLISLSDRKTRIHTGYGVEGDLTDIGTSYIQSDVITPAFRAGDYYGGLNGAVDAMMTALGGQQIVPDTYNTQQTSSDTNFGLIFGFGLIILQWFLAIFARSKSWWEGGVAGGIAGLLLWYFFISSLLIALPLLLLLVGFGLLLD